MEEKTYLFLLAGIIIKTIESDKNYKNLKAIIIREGHFNGRIYSRVQMSSMVMKNFARYMMIIAMYISRERFYEMMQKLADEIYRTAESEVADIINQSHARKKTSIPNKMKEQ